MHAVYVFVLNIFCVKYSQIIFNRKSTTYTTSVSYNIAPSFISRIFIACPTRRYRNKSFWYCQIIIFGMVLKTILSVSVSYTWLSAQPPTNIKSMLCGDFWVWNASQTGWCPWPCLFRSSVIIYTWESLQNEANQKCTFKHFQLFNFLVGYVVKSVFLTTFLFPQTLVPIPKVVRKEGHSYENMHSHSGNFPFAKMKMTLPSQRWNYRPIIMSSSTMNYCMNCTYRTHCTTM